TEHPFKESLRARHMIALYRDGRQAEALRVYQLTRKILGEELGVEPSRELRELEERILQHDPSLIVGADTGTETVALLFTDIAGSASLWEANPDATRHALAVHDEIVHAAITESGGRIVTHTGEGVLAAFVGVGDAGGAAVTAQQRLASADWGRLGSLDVKTAIDFGEVEVRAGHYFGPVVNRGARLVAAAHGGQIVLSSMANEQLSTGDGVRTRGLGEHRFRGLGTPQGVFQLVVDGLPADFPPLDTGGSVGEAVRHFGDAIRGYELREQIGSGPFGVVYRAYQPAVGREVAVKVIRPEYANHSAFVRSFESEARLVAKLSHPHIVPLFDFWRDSEGAYLVTPLLGRGSLADVEGALPPERVSEIVRQVGSALAYAHRQGVIHRNVKASNLLVDGESNVYVSDFGLALRSVEEAIGDPHPSPYRAPEEGTGAPVSDSLDVFGLAAVAAELLTGRGPAPSTIEALPEPLRTVVQTGLAPDPSLRHPTVDAFVAALLAATGQHQPAALAGAIARNPYKGLSAFDEADGQDFFGRTKEIHELLSLVERHRMVTVVGPSGSGKSSLVKAGLVPALRARHPDQHLVVTCVPGAHPFDELATALGGVANQPLNQIAEELRSDQHGLLRLTKRLSMDLGCEIMIIVDQFEELYSLVGDDAARVAFVESLLEATQDPHSKVRILTTIRADFFDNPLLDGRLGNVVADAHLTLAVPGAEALLEAIEGPAALVGLSLEDGIPNRIVGDVEREPGALPLLQFVLTDLVDNTEGSRITGADYDNLGGATGALANRATAVYEGLTPADRETAHHVFLRMVTVSEDADDVRRRVRRAELESLELDPGSLDQVIASFTEARLLTLDRDPITRGPTVEVAHEALIREWDLLGRWIADKREALLVRRRLGAMLQDWLDGDRADDLLPVGTRLSQFEDWVAAGEPTSTEERAFVDAAVRRREAAAEARRRRRNRTIAGFAVAAVVASALAIFASLQWRAADTEATRSRARELVAVADSVTESDPELALLVALEAVDEYASIGDAVPVPAQQLLHDAIVSHRVVARIPGGEFVTAKPDGSALATQSEDGGYAVWDISGAEPRRTASFAPPGGLSALAAWWEDGPFLHALVSDEDETWWLAGVTPDGEWREKDSWIAMPAERPTADLSPDSSRFAYLSQDGITLADTADGRVLSTISGDELPTPGGFVPFLQFGESGHLFFGSESGESVYDVWRVDAESGAEISLITSTEFPPLALAESPDGRILFIGGDSVTANVDMATGEYLWQQSNMILARPYWLSEDRMVGGGAELTVVDVPTGEAVRVVPANRADGDYAYVAGTGLFASSGTEDVALIDVGSDVVVEVGP
ncbi:MAG: protein kinase, partial [Acidimicrobiia bacterium]|nr:protein kinase [Acidimicrobiia bacterium]